MKPRNFTRETGVLEARQDIQERERLIEAIVADRDDAVTQAWAAMRQIVGEDQITDAITGSQNSPVIVLDRRKDEDTGDYVIVGKLEIIFSERGTQHEEVKAKFTIGTAFEVTSDELLVKNNKLHKLSGFGNGEKTWYGKWQTEESTDDVIGEIDEIRNWGTQRGKYLTLPEVTSGAQRKLNSFRESIDYLVEAPRTPALNPVDSTSETVAA